MERSARLYNCASCHVLVVICNQCDRNNIYCSLSCSEAARSKSCQLASIRYQKSLRGRSQHALRQKRYRQRKKKKVTHHSSSVSPSRAVLPSTPNEGIRAAMKGQIHCHFCGESCSPLLRHGYLRHQEQKSKPRPYFWPVASHYHNQRKE